MPDPFLLGPLALLAGAASNALVGYINGRQIRSSNQDIEMHRARVQLELQELHLDSQEGVLREQRKLQLELSALTRESLRLQVAEQLRNTLQGIEHTDAMKRWPLRLLPSQILNLFEGVDPVPLVVIVSPPKLQFDRVAGPGQGLQDVEGSLSAQMTGFLNQHYLPHGNERPVRFLGGALETKAFARESLLAALWGFLRSLPLLVLDSEVDGDLLRLNVGGWGTGRETFWYGTIGSFPYRSLLQRSARRRAEGFRAHRNEMLRQGRSREEIAQILGEPVLANLALLDTEERFGDSGRALADQVNGKLLLTKDDAEEVHRGLHLMHCLLVAGFADLHHLTRYDVEPRLPWLIAEMKTSLPPEFQEVFDHTVTRFAESYQQVYSALLQERPAFTPELSDRVVNILKVLHREDLARQVTDRFPRRTVDMESKDFLGMAKRLSEITQRYPDIRGEIDLAIKEFEQRKKPFIQLYGVSQAGKSTLVSALTLGEQYLPVGTGKATTAVQVEIIGVAPSERPRAEVEWLTREDLLALLLEPVAAFVDLPGEEQEFSAQRLLKKLDLEREDDRLYLFKALRHAERFRRRIHTDSRDYVVGGGNDLAVARIILRHYDQYAREYQTGFIELPELSTLPQWTREPQDWGHWKKRPLKSYTFDELRSFFTRRVRLHVSGASVLEGLRLVDSPGFGVSRMHDRICREIQESADAVLLVMAYSGSPMTLEQMNEIRQLAAGLRENLFIIWNPKLGSKAKAQDDLERGLIQLRGEAGVNVPRERAVVANLLLALRATQWLKLKGEGSPLSPLTLESLAEMYCQYNQLPPDPYDTANRAEELIEDELRASQSAFARHLGYKLDRDTVIQARLASGLDTDVVALFEVIRKSQERRNLWQCVTRVTDATAHFLVRFPTPQSDNKAQQDLENLVRLSTEIADKKKELEESMEDKLAGASQKLYEEFVSYLSDSLQRDSLGSVVAREIRSKVHHSSVPGMLEAKFLDYAKARFTVWTKAMEGFETRVSKKQVLQLFEESATTLQGLVKHAGFTAPVELPAPPRPRIHFEAFRCSFEVQIEEYLEGIFKPNWISRFFNWAAEVASDMIHGVKMSWSKLKSRCLRKSVPKPEQKPSFKREEAAQEARKAARELFDKSVLKNLLEDSWSDAQEAISKATLEGFSDWVEKVQKTLGELHKQLESSPAPLPVATVREIERLIRQMTAEEPALQEASEQIGRLIRERRSVAPAHPETLTSEAELSGALVPFQPIVQGETGLAQPEK